MSNVGGAEVLNVNIEVPNDDPVRNVSDKRHKLCNDANIVETFYFLSMMEIKRDDQRPLTFPENSTATKPCSHLNSTCLRGVFLARQK